MKKKQRKKQKYSDVSTVEDRRNFLAAEEVPEGAYGSPINKFEPVENKNTPWQEEQRFHSAFNFPDKDFHDDLPRQVEPKHPLHDHKGDIEPQEEQE
ncbi:hypothetical protein [Sediminibacillus halophilus]|uniref:Cytosolic protein n=1 Tax=Sediminibacillus halophilus TaxID=482461 RepID=A0A1G9QSJ4_9BACI|nr:hypothetical protein [Sediminibacillus halophilus]SDM13992.1 hypothetical protein SAMN05216244_1645 [Sediminibacillus halophilus]